MRIGDPPLEEVESEGTQRISDAKGCRWQLAHVGAIVSMADSSMPAVPCTAAEDLNMRVAVHQDRIYRLGCLLRLR